MLLPGYGQGVGRKKLGSAVAVRGLGHVRFRFMVGKEISSCQMPVWHLGESRSVRSIHRRCDSGCGVMASPRSVRSIHRRCESGSGVMLA